MKITKSNDRNISRCLTVNLLSLSLFVTLTLERRSALSARAACSVSCVGRCVLRQRHTRPGAQVTALSCKFWSSHAAIDSDASCPRARSSTLKPSRCPYAGAVLVELEQTDRHALRCSCTIMHMHMQPCCTHSNACSLQVHVAPSLAPWRHSEPMRRSHASSVRSAASRQCWACAAPCSPPPLSIISSFAASS